ncbi:MAG TPA: hypothetical protein VM118_13015 [Acidobacteriota bacterium]|nr:hypothetical protein [Acidobacteriota bacterium]
MAGLPTVILARSSGTEVDRILGFMGPREFIKTINEYQEGIGTLTALVAEESEPDKRANPEFLLRLGEKLYAHSRFEDADQRFQAIEMLDPKNVTGFADDALYKRVLVSRKKELWDDGLAICLKLAERFPESELIDDAAAYVAFFHEQAGRIDEAIAACKDYLDKWPKGDDAEWAARQIKELEANRNKKKGG